MGRIEDKYCIEGYDAQEAFNLADEIIANLEARVAALEDAITSQESRRPDPNADREVKWAIIRDGRVYDSENGFRKDYNRHPLLIDTREQAICVCEILNLPDVDRGGEIEVRRVYVDTLELVNPNAWHRDGRAVTVPAWARRHPRALAASRHRMPPTCGGALAFLQQL